ncbi:hypothetical protein Taro_041560, partial [Colocasia esculenta]|nr:hypothetical protein [Colocasia esculenta]
SKCVDTTGHCVDTTGNCCRTGFWVSELVSTHRWTVSTPLADCVDTQADCVDITSYCFRTGFWDSELVSTHRNMFALTRKVMTTNLEKLFLTCVQGGWTEPLELLAVGAGQQRLHLGGVLPQREDGVKGSERLWRQAGVPAPGRAFCRRRCPLPSSERCTGCQSLHRLCAHPACSSLLCHASSCISSEDLFFFGQGDQPKGSEISLLEVPTTKEVSVPVAPSSDRETVVADQSEGGLEMEENVTKTRTHLNEAQLLLMKDLMNHNLQIKETEASETYAKTMQSEESFAQQKFDAIIISSEIGYEKPDAKIFEAALGLDLEICLQV